MMNASFRTAFWALCLGLTVPMLLFVGNELTNGRAAEDRRVPAAGLGSGSLRARWNASSTPLPGTGSDAPRSIDKDSPGHVAGRESPRRNRAIAGATLIPRLEPDGANSGLADAAGAVVLGPQLESDPAAPEPQPAVRPRFPAIPTGTRPRAEIVPHEPIAAPPPAINRIESQLDEILDHLGRLATRIRDREAPPDPMQQATELLMRLQQARHVQQLASQLPVLSGPEAPPDGSQPSPEPLPKSEAPPASEATATSPPAAPVPSGDPAPPLATMPAPPLDSPARATTPLQSKIYRPRYIAVRALETLATPLLSPVVGRIGSASSETEHAAADVQGELPTQWDALVVRDVPEVLRKIDRLMQELDVPPVKILLEATILTVRLNPTMPYGVDLGEFNASAQPFSIHPADLVTVGRWGSPGRQPLPTAMIPTLAHGTGVKSGILRGDARAFLQVLHAATQIRGTVATQATVVNKQTTEILVGDGFASAGDGARPLSSGTMLRVRPIVSRDELIHLEIRPVFEPEATAWTEGILAREGTLGNQLTLRSGETAVVSGLIADHLVTHSYNKSGMGELPLVGHWFRGEAGVLQRTETIVLLTPHLAENEAPTDTSVSKRDPPKPRPGTKAPPKLLTTRPRTGDRLAATPPQRPASSSEQRPATPASGAVRPAAASSTEPNATLPREPQNTPNEIRQAAAVAVPKASPASPTRKRRAPVRRSVNVRNSSTNRDPAGLDEIPEIPLPVDASEMQGPLIRPARESRARLR